MTARGRSALRRAVTVPLVLAAAVPLSLLLPPAAQGAAAGPSVRAVSSQAAHAPVLRWSQMWTVTALGDSVPAGAACDCSPFPLRLGTRIGHRGGHPVSVHNHAESGSDSEDLLQQVRLGPVTDGDIRRSQVVTVTTGANDVSYTRYRNGRCGDDVRQCYHRDLAQMYGNVRAILARIASLDRGRTTRVLVTGYWNVWVDGRLGARRGATYVRDSVLLTKAVNNRLHAAAARYGARYVDLVPAFDGPGVHTTALLADDGDHPDAAGHRAIATALLAALP